MENCNGNPSPTQIPMDSEEAQGLGASELFFRLSRELMGVAQALNVIDNALGAHVKDGELVTDVQAIDQSRQVIEDISRILVTVSKEERICRLTGDFLVSKNIRLMSLKNRLNSSELNGFLDNAAAGGVEFF